MDQDKLVRAQIQKTVESFLEHTITWVAALNAASKFSNGARCLEGKGIAKWGGRKRGSFNMCYWVNVEGQHCEWVVRFPLLGMFPIQSIRRKMKSEVATILFLEEKTNVRVARVIGYNIRDEVELPFIITESIRGLPLNVVLAVHGDKPGVKEKIMFSIAEQYLELLSHPFDRIGSLTLSETGNWSVSYGPLGVDMFDISQDGVEIRDLGPFSNSSEYFATQIELHGRYLEEQSNSVFDKDDARQKYLTTHLFPSILQRFVIAGTANGPFFLTHADLHESNVMINYKFEVAAILDWELSCTMPFEVASAPPLCLAGTSPVDLMPSSTEYEIFEENIKLFARTIHQILPNRQMDHKMDIASAVTEAVSHKRALFAWAINDVRHMHEIFWDHLAPFVYRIRPPPIKQTENIVDTEDVDMVSEKDFVNTELLDEKYGNLDNWVKERLKSLEEYKKEMEVWKSGGILNED
jgi:hypothetical protein